MTPVILFNNAILNSSIDASSQASGYLADYLRDGNTFTSWKSGSDSRSSLTIDFGSALFISAIGIIGHNLGEVKAVVKLLKSENGTTWEQVLTEFTVLNNNGILKLLSTSAEAQYIELERGGFLELEQGGYLPRENSGQFSARYWKITIDSIGVPEIAVLYFGEFIQFEFPPDSPVIPLREKIIASSAFSNEGHLLGTDLRYKSGEASFTFVDISASWFKTQYQKFWDECGLDPFLFAVDLENRPDDVYYMKLADDSVKEEPLSIFNNVDQLQISMVKIG